MTKREQDFECSLHFPCRLLSEWNEKCKENTVIAGIAVVYRKLFKSSERSSSRRAGFSRFSRICQIPVRFSTTKPKIETFTRNLIFSPSNTLREFMQHLSSTNVMAFYFGFLCLFCAIFLQPFSTFRKNVISLLGLATHNCQFSSACYLFCSFASLLTAGCIFSRACGRLFVFARVPR